MSAVSVFGRIVCTIILTFSFFCNPTVYAQQLQAVKKTDSNGFSYETVEGDPLKARIYTLKNGLTVYLTEYHNEPRVQTFVAVRAGSKTDPATHTGLAHYLEHLMFKGSSKIGSSNWKEEEKLIDEIEKLYNVYGQLQDTALRANVYAEIDSVSSLAAKYAIANEYDKLLSNIGAQGTNAYTWFEQTVYVNDIPSNEIEKWAQIESERFGEVVPRLFHTELEAVYEEKNRGLDSDRRKTWEAMFAGLFQKHQYGTQTTLGTIDHLQNPSITEIKKYFKANYIPNNMAVCMSGDFDTENTIKVIDKHFSKLKSAPLPSYIPPVESPIKSPVIKEVKGPDAESVSIGFRFPGRNSKESLIMELISMILSNSQAGLIDLNLNQKQAVLGAYAFPLRLKDYSTLILGGTAKEGQSLEETRDLLLAQLEIIKKGEFDDWLLPAIINDYKRSRTIEYESNKSRADAFVQSFIYHTPWVHYVHEIDALSKITKKEIVGFANNMLKDNYVIVYKRTGEDQVKKVSKPKITPVEVNREQQSEFYKQVFAQKSEKIQPVYLDFDKDISKSMLANDIQLLYNQNKENDLFELYYVFDIGRNNDKKLSLAVQYLNYIGTDKYSAEEIKKEFYKLGCDFSVFTSEDQVYVSLDGLNSSFEKALELFEEFLASTQADDKALKELIGRILKSRENSKLDKRKILSKGLVNYAKYGPKNPFTNILSTDELNATKGDVLVHKLKELYKYDHRVLYYGPQSQNQLSAILNKTHKTAAKKKEVPAPIVYKELPIDKNEVLFIDYDMVQTEIVFLSQSEMYNKNMVPKSKLFNEYFGGNMGSIVFQELRESKALAYSVRSSYSIAKYKDRHNYVVSYIGTQSDKIFDAIEGMEELLTTMPVSQNSFANAQESIRNSMATDRIIKSSKLFAYEKAKKLGLDYDIRKDIYEFNDKATIEDIKAFHSTYLKGQKKALLVIGKKDNIDIKALGKYGAVKELTLEEVFGY